MVSRRNFLTITVIMLVLLFMFQTPEVVKDRMNHYEVNQYTQESIVSLDAKTVSSETEKNAVENGRYIVFIGDQKGDIGQVVTQWCNYSKRYLKVYSQITDYQPEQGKQPEALLLDADVVQDGEAASALLEWAAAGTNLVFCSLPDILQIKVNGDLRELLGIQVILADHVTVEGIHLFEGLLLGGEKIYQLEKNMRISQQDLELEMPWCQLAAGTKAYMVGMKSSVEKNENLPAIVWRNSVGSANIFVVNGDYISSNTGLGFLEGMMYENSSYALYPVVNAQNLVVLNYPGFASENEAEMMTRYSQSLKAVYRDIVWPGLAATSETSSKKMTCMITPQLDYSDEIEPEEDMLVYYMKLLQEQQAEAGISTSAQVMGAGGIENKLERDAKFLDTAIPDYEFSACYAAGLSREETVELLKKSPLLEKVRTLFYGYSETGALFFYETDGVTGQRITNEGCSHTFSEDIRMNSIQTALAYSSIAFDIQEIAYPESDKDNWEKLYEKFSSNTNTYWKAYETLASTTLTESDTRIRRYLALDYTQQREADSIVMDITNFEEEAWFILRTHGEEIREAEGAQYDEIQKNVYLVNATVSHVVLNLGEAEQRMIYE